MRPVIAALAASLAFGAVSAPYAATARDGISPSAAAALGVLGGVAVGSAIASSRASDDDYRSRRVYGPPPVEREVVVVERPRRVFVEDVGPTCHYERRRRVDEYGDVFIMRVRVCE